MRVLLLLLVLSSCCARIEPRPETEPLVAIAADAGMLVLHGGTGERTITVAGDQRYQFATGHFVHTDDAGVPHRLGLPFSGKGGGLVVECFGGRAVLACPNGSKTECELRCGEP